MVSTASLLFWLLTTIFPHSLIFCSHASRFKNHRIIKSSSISTAMCLPTYLWRIRSGPPGNFSDLRYRDGDWWCSEYSQVARWARTSGEPSTAGRRGAARRQSTRCGRSSCVSRIRDACVRSARCAWGAARQRRTMRWRSLRDRSPTAPALRFIAVANH